MMASRLYVVHLPSTTQSAWQTALSEAATQAGWDICSVAAGCEPALRDGVPTLVQAADASLLPPDAVSVVILGASPQEATDQLMQFHEMDRQAALNSVGWWFAQAADAAERGAAVLDARAEAIDLPGLGSVQRGLGGTVERTATGEPLAMYAVLPPPIGATAFWPGDLFHWTAGADAGTVDLTGKARVLLHGPYLVLSRGTWEAEIIFELDIDRAITQLRFDWGNGVDVVETTHRLSVGGVYSVNLSKTLTRPSHTEFRVWLDRSMFDGRFTVQSVKVTRTA